MLAKWPSNTKIIWSVGRCFADRACSDVMMIAWNASAPAVTGPVKPLTPEQVKLQEAQAAAESWLHRDAVAIDQATNVIVLKGQPDETISSHAARAATEGKWWGKALSMFLNLFQKDHGAKAEAGDLERAQNIERIEPDGDSE